jgi:hypothetical protein
MNPLLIETALKTALTASAFSGTTIYTGTGYSEMTPESLNLIVGVSQLDHVAGSLYKATVDIKVTAPSLLGSDSLTSLNSTLETLRTTALTNSYLSANWPGSSAAGYAGLWVLETKMSQHDHVWVAEITVVLGVTE